MHRYITLLLKQFIVRSNFLSVSGRSDSEPTMCLSLTPAPGGVSPARRPSITVTRLSVRVSRVSIQSPNNQVLKKLDKVEVRVLTLAFNIMSS